MISQRTILGIAVVAWALVPSGLPTFGQSGGIPSRSQEPARAARDAADRPAAPIRSSDKVAQAVSRFAELLQRHPARRRAAGKNRLALYMMDLVGGGTTLIADEPGPG